MTLPAPSTAAGRDALDAVVARPDQVLLALDFDGVLAPIVADPSRSRAHPRVVPILVRLARHLGAMAVITGRPAAVAVAYAGFDAAAGLGGLVVLGHYGAERWDARTGRVEAPPVPAGVAGVREALPALLSSLGLQGDAHIEDKGRSVAVHTRRSPQPDATLAALEAPLAALADHHDLVVEPGRMVIELRPPGVDKGGALRRLAAERGSGTVIYAGDDLGDLPAFAAVDVLRAEGLAGLKVASASGEVPQLLDRADLVVDGPDGVVELLEALADQLDRRHPAPAPLDR